MHVSPEWGFYLEDSQTRNYIFRKKKLNIAWITKQDMQKLPY